MLDLSHIDLLSLIGRDTHLKKAASTGGGEWSGMCPICNAGEDRFRVQPYHKPNARWMCRFCSGWQDAIGYIRKRDHCTFREALEALNITSDYKPMPKPDFKRHIQLAPMLAPMPIQESWLADWTNQLLDQPDLVEYLGKRGVIDPEQAKVGYTGNDQRLKKHWQRDKIVIPHYHEGVLTAIKLRNNPFTTGGGYITLSDEDNPLIGKSSYALPFGIDEIQKSKVMCGIETELDSIGFSQLLGVPFCAVPAGSVKNPDGTWSCHSFKPYYVDYFLHAEKIAWFCDNDDSGRAFARAIKSKIGIVDTYFPPARFKDFGEFYQHDKEMCISLMSKAIFAD